MVKKQNLTGVVQVIDKLAMGGMERIAVDVANCLPQERYRSYFCTTRWDGPLRADLAPHVGYICLRRKHRFDLLALRSLVSFIRDRHISIIHAHGSALFVASLVSLLPPFPKVVYHCHSGWSGEDLPVLPYLGMMRRAQAAIAVNDLIRQWITQRLRYPADRIWYVPNFSSLLECQFAQEGPSLTLPGTPGRRIVCVSRFEDRKDQLTLIRAMPAVLDQVPDAHLILVGREWDKSYANTLKQESKQLGLESSVTFLGVRRDVAAILTACDVGVLSSVSEGLPVALLEYGLAGLGVICTQVGQCAEVLDEGRAGLLVQPKDPAAMASALASMLLDASRRRVLANRLQERVRSHYSIEQAIEKIDYIYKTIGGQD
jgi:glycosyltransferase involved in cell wall biosynthesis